MRRARRDSFIGGIVLCLVLTGCTRATVKTRSAPPVRPSGVAATAGNGQVTVTWSSATGVSSYNLYWSTTSGVSKAAGTKIAGVTSPYRHTGLSNRTVYYYIVTAMNATGESVESAEVKATPDTTPPLGINLEQVTEHGPSMMFADAIWHSSPWGNVSTPYDRAAAVDQDGWPTSDAGVIVMLGVPNMGGTYQLFFTGSATSVAPYAQQDPNTAVQNLAWAASTNTSTAAVVVGSNEKVLALVFTGTTGGVRNVRLLRPGHTQSEVFTQPFLDRIARFGVIRYMDYLATNNNPQGSWSDRTLPTHATQQRQIGGCYAGAAWEHVVELANLTGTDLWINIPDQATDDYILQLATLLNASVDPQRKIYVEWSNEVWNGIFLQASRNVALTTTEVNAGGSNLAFDSETNLDYLSYRRTARNLMRASDIFRAVFGDAAMMSRVRPVLAGNLADAAVLNQGLKLVASVDSSVTDYFYAVAVAPYVGVANPLAALDLDQIFASMTSEAANTVNAQIVAAKQIADAYHLPLVAYEGGSVLFAGIGATPDATKRAAQSDSRMKTLIVNLLEQQWADNGGELFNYYHLCSTWSSVNTNVIANDFYGLSDDITSEVTPKWDAVKLIIGAN